MKKKYLKLYEQWMITGKLPEENGLCNEFGNCHNLDGGWDFNKHPLFELMLPDAIYSRTGFWASEHDNNPTIPYIILASEFGELRQTIVLFMAAMNDEL